MQRLGKRRMRFRRAELDEVLERGPQASALPRLWVTPVCQKGRSTLGVSKYQSNEKTFWMVDEWFPLPNGRLVRFRKRKIPTREQAMALVAKRRAEAFEGRYLERPKTSKLVVEQAWKAYQPISERDNDTANSESGRAKHLVRILGQRVAAELTVKDVDEYRATGSVRKRCAASSARAGVSRPRSGAAQAHAQLRGRVRLVEVQSHRNGEAASEAERAPVSA
jgi:hypothetical protein